MFTLRRLASSSISNKTLLQKSFSTIPVKQIASVLKLNVGDEATAIKMDAKMKAMHVLMKEHEGFSHSTRYVCKSEWAYELSFIFSTPESFGAWAESPTREKVHAFYLESIKEVGIKEEDIYGGARVIDKWE